MDELSQKVVIIAFLSLFILVVTVAIISMVLLYQNRQMKFIKEKEKMIAFHSNELLQTQLEIQEQTLKNISQEIHDNIGQVLSLVKLNINTMDCLQKENMNEKIKDSKLLISKAIQDLRDLSKSMNTDYLIETGLEDAIAYEVEILKRAKSYHIDVLKKGSSYRLEDQQQLILLRIVQEALHNIIKHAHASHVQIALDFRQEAFLLQISDNGRGFNESEIINNSLNGSGLGLRNMKNRARLIDAEINIESTAGNGTLITVSLPTSKINT